MVNICIIIPCYNEELRLNESAFDLFLSKGQSFSFIFVNDGSKDNTLIVLKKFKNKWPEKVEIVDLAINMGKAEAVRTGINLAISCKYYDYVGFLDADLSTPLSELIVLSKI